MISVVSNPALEALVASVAPALVFGQVWLQRGGGEFVLQHEADRGVENLRLITVQDLRELAQFTERGAFRPLKSAPTLRRGWQCVARDEAELDTALRHLYPGGVADWFAARQEPPPAISYRAFTARQTGMYRITAMLDDAQAALVARAGCHRNFCLKRRLWAVEGLPSESVVEKSELACLEPCAVLMEFARAVMRIEQKGGEAVSVSGSAAPSDQAGGAEVREGDFSSPSNPRFQQWRLEKTRSAPVSKVN